MRPMGSGVRTMTEDAIERGLPREGDAVGAPRERAKRHAVRDTMSAAHQAMHSASQVGAILRQHAFAVVVALVALVALVIACWQFLPGVYAWVSDADAVRAFVAEHAVLSRLAMLGINIAQILVAVLPGEPVELASGYAFGFWEGTALCLVASAIASSAIFWAVRRWGWSVVGIFFDRSYLERFGWLTNTRRLELIMLVVFLIPGTPKDFLTYFAGLTEARFRAVFAITTLGRIPSIVTSTIAASAFGSGNYGVAIIAVVAAGLLILVGGIAYRKLEARHRA